MEAILTTQHTVRPHIIAIDDDPTIRQMLADYLTDNDLRVTSLASGRDIASIMARESVHLILLDLRLSCGEDGIEIARELRGESDVPIIMLTARKEEADRVIGLEVGADDYLTKPFSLRELLARIRALLRRHQSAHRGRPKGVRAYRFDGWELNLNTRSLRTIDGRQQGLSNGEFNVLAALLDAPQRILSRDQILDRSRLHNDEVYKRSVDTQVMRLRKKVEIDPARPGYIRTERGVGYRFAVPVEALY
jgi:two-component system OmpR family response regulator